jgi:predicted CXXCH cytochrome family protein
MMKKAIVALALIATASMAAAQVANTPHNMLTNGPSSGPYGGSTAIAGMDQVCVFCHAPHHVNTGFVGAPLWNRATPSSTYTVYTSATLSATLPNPPNASSLACLSCHDGSANVGTVYNYGTATGGATGAAVAILTGGTQTISGVNSVGTDLRNDHPVGIAYPATGDFNAAVGGAVNGLPLYGATDTVECGSCHDPHDNANNNFLRASNAASALCLDCHIK